MRLLDLPTWDGREILRAVVETPRGSIAKFKYEPELEVFTYSRPLAHGLRYPFDWGFLPRTLAPDGDPIDVMILHDAASYPGVVIRCRPLAVLKVTQQKKKGKGRERNDRVLAVPAESSSAADPPVLDRRLRRELEQFFQGAVLMEGKDLRLAGWGVPWEAKAIIRAAQRAFEQRAPIRT